MIVYISNVSVISFIYVMCYFQNICALSYAGLPTVLSPGVEGELRHPTITISDTGYDTDAGQPGDCDDGAGHQHAG